MLRQIDLNIFQYARRKLSRKIIKGYMTHSAPRRYLDDVPGLVVAAHLVHALDDLLLDVIVEAQPQRDVANHLGNHSKKLFKMNLYNIPISVKIKFTSFFTSMC